MVNWIPFWQWNSWTPEQRGEVSSYYESLGQKWAIDLTQDKAPNKRVGEAEEYEGEAIDRQLDHRGFNFPYPYESSIGRRK